jgi:putative endonuclease
MYIMSNKYRTVLYIGVTSNLFNRVYEHKQFEKDGFTSKYKCVELVYFECFSFIDEAIRREKQLKKWNREWKENLIMKMNPEMKDLSDEIEDYR